MKVRLLGPLEVLDTSGAPVPVGGPRVAALLALLALRPGQVVSTDRLIEDLWGGEPPAGAANGLQSLVAKLRRCLGGADAIRTVRPGYMLSTSDAVVDVGRFDELVAQGREALAAGDAERGSTLLSDALAMWRGEALADFQYEEWAQPVIVRLSETRLTVIEDRAQADLDRGLDSELVGPLEAAVHSSPLRERLRGQLMLALYRSGRQAEALRVFQDGRRLLSDELGLEPGPELRRLESSIAAADPSLEVTRREVQSPAARVRPSSNLKVPLTATVGRAKEISELCDLIGQRRLVTVIGVGGAGKTRVSLEVARAVRERFAGGAWMVELAALVDPQGIIPAIAAALDIPVSSDARTGAVSGVASYIGCTDTLIVVDNCEHLISEAARVAENLLAACPGLRIVATSREALGVPGEQVWPLPPLGVEDATVLFTECASAADVNFELAGETASVVADVCRRLDGLPLAIELAAARVRAFPVEQIADRLDDRFRLLTGGARTALPRQQTLRAVLDWSYDLLFDEERRVFERLSAFAGGWDLNAAEAVCSDATLPAADVADVVRRLVDKSLVTVEHVGGQARYSMLQTLAHYGRERLAESGGADDVRDRHARWFAAIAGQSWAAFRGDGQSQWLSRAASDMEDLRLAFEFSTDRGDADLSLTIAGGLGWYWWLTGQSSEGLRWLDRALSQASGGEAVARAWAVTWHTYLRLPAGRLQQSPEVEDALQLWEKVGDNVRWSVCAFLVAQLELAGSRPVRAAELMGRARNAFAEEKGPWETGIVHFLDGHIAERDGHLDAAEAAFAEASDSLGAAGDGFRSAVSFGHRGELAAARGDYPTSGAALADAARGLAELGLWGQYVFVTVSRANLAMAVDDLDLAASLHEEALNLARAMAPTTLALTLTSISGRHLRSKEYAEADAAAEQALDLYEGADIAAGIAVVLGLLGASAQARDDGGRASDLCNRAYVEARRGDDPPSVAFALEGLAAIAAGCDEWTQVARLLGAAAAQREIRVALNLRVSGGRFTVLQAPRRHDLDVVVRAARSHLGDDGWRTEYNAGRAEPVLDITTS